MDQTPASAWRQAAAVGCVATARGGCSAMDYQRILDETRAEVLAGIVAVMPGQWVAAVGSPALNESGNSAAGVRAIELLTTKSAVSIF